MEFHQPSLHTVGGIIYNYYDKNNTIIWRIISNLLISISKKVSIFLKTIFKIIIDPKITANLLVSNL